MVYKEKKRPMGRRNYNFLKRLVPTLMDGRDNYLKLEAPPFPDLIIERLSENEIAITQYSEDNGSLMSNPEIIVRVASIYQIVEPVIYRHDSLGIYEDIEELSFEYKSDISKRLGNWLERSVECGFKVVSTNPEDEIRNKGRVSNRIMDEHEQRIDIPIEQRNYSLFKKFAPSILEGNERFLKYSSPQLIDLLVEQTRENQITMGHYYMQDGTLSRNPEIVFQFDNEKRTILPLAFQNIDSPIGNSCSEIEDSFLCERIGFFLNEWIRNTIEAGYELEIASHYDMEMDDDMDDELEM